jgi:hypothetical protein
MRSRMRVLMTVVIGTIIIISSGVILDQAYFAKPQSEMKSLVVDVDITNSTNTTNASVYGLQNIFQPSELIVVLGLRS